MRQAIYETSRDQILSELTEFSSLAPDAYMKAVLDYFVHPDDHEIVADAFGKVRGKTPRPSYAFIMIDLDDFKAINDNFGHDAGDEVLLETVKQIKEFFPKQSLIGRFGGDEFMVLCPFSRSELLIETINRFMENTIPPYSVKKVWATF